MANAGTPLTPTHHDRRRWIALVVVCLAMLMNALDGSIVNVALPAIERDLHFSQSGLTWVIDAYMIAFGAFLLLAGRLGDLLGRKKVFLAGVALFTLSSLGCTLATNQSALIVGRFAEGLGGAVSTSVIMAIIVTEFPAPTERARALSAYLLVTVGGGALGLLAGGVLTQEANWHWIFLINLPIGAVTIVAGWLLIDENVGLGIRRGVDVPGSLLVTAGVLVGTYGIVKASDYGWGSDRTVLSLGLAVLLLAGFAAREATAADPIMPLRIFRIRSLAASSAVRGCLFSGMNSVFFLGALYLEHVGGYSPLRTGFAFLPATIVIIVLSSGITARVLTRFGPMKPLSLGLAAVAGGLALNGLIGVHVAYFSLLLPAYLLIGGGMGVAGVPLLTLAMADVPKTEAGLASGIVNVSMWLASAIGLAVTSTIAAGRTKTLLASGHPEKSALVGGYALAYIVAASCVGFGIVLVLVLLRTSARNLVAATAAEVASTSTVAAAEGQAATV